MRLAFLLAAVSTLAAAFSGCLEGDLSLLTAKDASGRAEGEAKDWAGDARLMGAVGFEAGPDARAELSRMMAQGQQGQAGARPEGPGGDEDASERAMFGALATTEDEDVGDGRAPVWSLTYWSVDLDASLQVVVTSQGISAVREGAAEEASVFGPLGADPVTDWRIDSDGGAEVARRDEAYAAAVASPDALVFTMLFQGKEGPVWIYGAETGDLEDGESLVALSARDGSVIEEDAVLGEVFGFLLRESGSSSGSANVGAGYEFFTDFEVQLGGHSALAVLVAVSPPPVAPMEIVVRDPGGTETIATLAFGPGTDASQSLVLDAVPTGSYEARVSTDLAVVEHWEISWCTDGEALVPMATVPACDLLPASSAMGSAGLLGPAGSPESLWETLSPSGRWALA
jgi:hypothetical protein